MKKIKFQYFKKSFILLLIAFLFLPSIPFIPISAQDSQAETVFGTADKIEAWITRSDTGEEIYVYSSDANDQITRINEAIPQDSKVRLRYQFTTATPPANNTNFFYEGVLDFPEELVTTSITGRNNNVHYTDDGKFAYGIYVNGLFDLSQHFIIHFIGDHQSKPENWGLKTSLEIRDIPFYFPNNYSHNSIKVEFKHNYFTRKHFFVNFTAKGTPKSFEKSARFFSDSNPNLPYSHYINPHQIKWGTNINYKTEAIPKENAIVVSTFDPTKLSYKEGSLKIYPNDLHLNGLYRTFNGASYQTDYYTILKENKYYEVDKSELENGKIKIKFLPPLSYLDVTTEPNTPSYYGINPDNDILDKEHDKNYMNQSFHIEYITDIKPEVVGSDIAVPYSATMPDYKPSENTSTGNAVIPRKYADGTTMQVKHMLSTTGDQNNKWLRWNAMTNPSQRTLDTIETVLPEHVELIKYGEDPFSASFSDPESVDIYDKISVRKVLLGKDSPQDPSQADNRLLTKDELKTYFIVTYDKTSRTLRLTPNKERHLNDPLYPGYYNDPFIYYLNSAYLLEFDTRYIGTAPEGTTYEGKITVRTEPGLSTGVFPASASIREPKAPSVTPPATDTQTEPTPPKVDEPKKEDTPKPEVPEAENPQPKEPKIELPPVVIPSVPEAPAQPNTPDRPIITGEIEIPDNAVPEIGRKPNNGIVELEKNRWTYTPNNGFHGKDEFIVIINYPDGETDEQIIEVEVPVPQGSPILPQTDGIPSTFFFLYGLLMIAFALYMKKK